MRRKVFLLIFLITNFVFAENGYYYVNLYEPYGKSPTYTEEITFYDDGLIKQIVHHNSEEGFTIHFLIDKKSKNLFSIVITSER